MQQTATASRAFFRAFIVSSGRTTMLLPGDYTHWPSQPKEGGFDCNRDISTTVF